MAKSRKNRVVYLDTVTANGVTIGIVRSILGRRKLAETGPHPNGFTDAALKKAAELAQNEGWTIIDHRTAEVIQ